MASSISPGGSLSADLLACLGRDDMTDVHLLGTDGVEVPAFRIILACRSDVLCNMLVGNCEESASKVVNLRYSSDVLRAVVEFCITDDVKQFDGRSDESAARGIVQLIACAHFLNMPLLEDKAKAIANTLLAMEEHHSLACAFFDEASRLGEPTSSVKHDALLTVRKFATVSLLSKPGILALGPDTISEIIGDNEMTCEEITLFRALDEWANMEVEEGNLFPISIAERVKIAKKVTTEHIRLSSILPTDLASVVRKSCLVDEKMVYEAFEDQAIQAEKECVVPTSKRRKVVVSGITVSGAGVDAVNGFYEKDGEHDCFPKYTKKGAWEGKDKTFCIYRWNGQWYISVLEKEGSIGDEDNDFYLIRNREKGTPDGWEAIYSRYEPCPVCRES